MYRISSRFLVLLTIAAMLGLALPGVSSGAGAEKVTVVAKGLDNPRGLAFGPDGGLYIAEAGKGGSGPCVAGPEGKACYGASGAITRVLDGEQKRVAKGLPSFAAPDGSAATGPVDISFAAGAGNDQQSGAVRRDGYVAVGALGPVRRSVIGKAGNRFGRLVRLVRKTGRTANVADLIAYEVRNDPDKDKYDSNPYSVFALSDSILAVDAGGNDLLRVKPNGRTSTVAVFPEREVRGPNGQTISMDSVPDAVAVGPDGAYYVGELTGFPFPKGGARVYRVEPGKKPKVFAKGFTNIIDVTFDADGAMYVLELFKGGLLAVDPRKPETLEGRLVKIAPNGKRTTIADKQLAAPTGVAVGPDGALYVSNLGILAEAGQVLRIAP